MKNSLKNAIDPLEKSSPEKEWCSENKLPPGWEKHEGESVDKNNWNSSQK